MKLLQHIQDNITGYTAHVYKMNETDTRCIVRLHGKIVKKVTLSANAVRKIVMGYFPNMC